MNLSALGTFLNTSFGPLMKAFQVTVPDHRTVQHGDDMERVLSLFQDVAFKATTEIHYATMMVKGRKVMILALQEPAAALAKPA
jgi:hypothetical protein